MKVRAAVVIVEDDQVALIKRVRDGRTYFVFPGGGVEDGETPEATAVREAFEELGVEVELGRLISEGLGNDRLHLHYLARVVRGEFGTGAGREMVTSGETPKGTYRPVWMDLDDLLQYEVRPMRLARVLSSRGLIQTRKVQPVEE